MKKALSVILAVLTALTCFSSCSSDDSSVLFFAVQDTAVTFDPQIAADGTAKIIVRNCFEGLVRIDGDSNITPGVAERWSISDDGLTYTFYLRQNALWHLTSNAQTQLEGKLPENFDLSVTAYDFEFGIRRALDPQTGAADAYILSNISNAAAVMSGEASADTAGVKAIDKTTLQITLSQPENGFLQKLAEPICMPCNQTFFEAAGGRYGILIKYSLSNGPFYLSRFNETSYRLNKSGDYAGNVSVKADAVWLYYVTDIPELLGDLADNGYSGAVLTDAQFGALKQTKHITATYSPDINRSFVINTNHPVLQNISIRNAFFAATDTAKLCTDANRTVCTSFVPPAACDEYDNSYTWGYSEEKARDFLKKGLDELEITSVSVTVITDSAFEEAIKRQLQEWQRILGVNFNIKVSALTAAELERAVKAGNYDIAFYPVKAPSNTADDYFSLFTEGNKGNITGFSDDTLSAAVKSLGDSSGNNREKIYTELVGSISAYAVILPVWQESTYLVCTKDISGVLYLTGSDRLYFENATDK